MLLHSNRLATVSRAGRFTCALGLLLLLTGCGGETVETYPLSGKVTYQGEMVPRGYILFEPNTKAGNAGPGTQVDIRDGHFTTLAGSGSIGGPHLVHVYGYDGKPVDIGNDPAGNAISSPIGRPMFPTYTFELDLPRQPAQHDFTVPAE